MNKPEKLDALQSEKKAIESLEVVSTEESAVITKVGTLTNEVVQLLNVGKAKMPSPKECG